MQATDECASLIGQTKTALVQYLKHLDSSLIQTDVLNIKNVLDVVDALTAPEETAPNNSGGFLSYITLPFTAVGSLITGIRDGVYATLYKTLSDTRKAQLRYLSQKIQLIQKLHTDLANYESHENLQQTQKDLIENVKQFLFASKWLCDKTESSTDRFSCGDTTHSISGLQHYISGNSKLANCLTSNIQDVFDIEEIIASINTLCVKFEDTISLAEQQEKMQQTLQINKKSTEYLKTELTRALIEEKLKNRLIELKAQHTEQELRKKNSALLQQSFFSERQHLVVENEHQSASSLAFTTDRTNRAKQYQQILAKLLSPEKQPTDVTHPLVTAVHKNNLNAVLSQLEKGVDLSDTQIQECVSQEGHNNSAKCILLAAMNYNLVTLFTLLQEATEASISIQQLRRTETGLKALNALQPHLWVQNAVPLLLTPKDTHKQSMRAIKNKSDKDVLQSEQALISLTHQLKSKALAPEELMMTELAEFLLHCIQHIKLIRSASDNFTLPFAEDMIVKRLAPVIEKITPDIEAVVKSNSTAKTEMKPRLMK